MNQANASNQQEIEEQDPLHLVINLRYWTITSVVNLWEALCTSSSHFCLFVHAWTSFLNSPHSSAIKLSTSATTILILFDFSRMVISTPSSVTRVWTMGWPFAGGFLSSWPWCFSKHVVWVDYKVAVSYCEYRTYLYLCIKGKHFDEISGDLEWDFTYGDRDGCRDIRIFGTGGFVLVLV